MSRLLAYSHEALEALWRNRGRSLLTVLGMIIGTASVIAVLGIGKAASNGIAGTLDSFGDPGIIVQVDLQQDDPVAATIQYRDVAQIVAATPDLTAHVFPSYQRTYKLSANGVDYDGTVVSQYDYINDTLTLREGRRINRDDVDNAARVALVTQPLESRLFHERRALGEDVRVNGERFRIIGVYDSWKAGIFNNIAGSDYIEIPYTTFHEMAGSPVDNLQIYKQPGATLPEVRDAVERVLRHIHGPQAKYDTQDAMAFEGAFERSIDVISYGLTAIGAVALLVAGIGVMNIMLVSVTERTREIGIRKAIGAGARDIATQFLLEAVILSLIGGGIGMIFGIGAVLLMYGVVAGLLGPAPIPWLLIVSVAVGFSMVVGVVFGTYPATRAAKLDPIEALRS
jgi:putative ABC transport system permease protein